MPLNRVSKLNDLAKGSTMKQNYHIRFTYLLLLFSGIFFSTSLFATDKIDANKVNVVIHVTKNHKNTYQAALNYTASLREHYGEQVNIAIVANGPGIGFVNSSNSYTQDITGLLKEGVKIYACNTTVRIMRQYQELPIIKGVEFVPTGIVQVVELQRKGYLYLNP